MWSGTAYNPVAMGEFASGCIGWWHLLLREGARGECHASSPAAAVWVSSSDCSVGTTACLPTDSCCTAQVWKRCLYACMCLHALGLAPLLHTECWQESCMCQVNHSLLFVCCCCCCCCPAAAAGHLTSTVRSMAVLRLPLPGRVWLRWQGCIGGPAAAAEVSGGGGRAGSTGCGACGQGGPQVARCLLTAAAPQLERFPPMQLATALWALGTLHHTPPRPWLLQLLSSTYQQLPRFNPGQLSQVIWGLAELDTTPSPLWLSRSGRDLVKPWTGAVHGSWWTLQQQ
ncbi:hypothetical protein COO60DRAFT_417991 [Scenedesmus sp. NREL 46B-D3]|nr:hypothetical protein COO60DRAFT_417991 [Scenedesmus sp. NREL 46B-D3]